jgi:hypothetical protein
MKSLSAIAILAASLTPASLASAEDSQPTMVSGQSKAQASPGTASPSYTSDPERWRPVAYADLAFPEGEAEAYASIWQDRLDESNAHPPTTSSPDSMSNPKMSFALGNRGASEWHFSANFQTKLVTLSVLYTPYVCTDEYPSPSTAARIKVCPMRLAVFQDGRYAITDSAACFLLKTGEGPIEDSGATTTQVAYDVGLRAFKIRYTVSHTNIAQCEQTVPLHPSSVAAPQ